MWQYIPYPCKVLLSTDTINLNTHSPFNTCSVLILFQVKIHNKCSKNPPSAWFQTFAAMYMRHALFWYITQRRVVTAYGRLGAPYPSHLQESISLGLDPWRCEQNVLPKRRYGITSLRCVISQKSAYLFLHLHECMHDTSVHRVSHTFKCPGALRMFWQWCGGAQ